MLACVEHGCKNFKVALALVSVDVDRRVESVNRQTGPVDRHFSCRSMFGNEVLLGLYSQQQSACTIIFV